MATLTKKAPIKKSSTKDQFVAKKIGANLIATFNNEKYSKRVTKEEADVVMKKMEMYNKKPSDRMKSQIITLLTPATTAAKKQAEVVEMKKKGYQKLIKKEKDSGTKEKAKVKASLKKIMANSLSENLDLIEFKDDTIVLKGFDKVPMPGLLVNKIMEALSKNADIKPLLNFWSLCLLNPNEIARTKLFDYLSHHRFIITPSGYFVTYRMVIKTGDKDVFTDAHTKTMKIKIGEVVSIPRDQCDEDGSRDCSKGLHVGSPDFIGIEKGDGYDKTTGQIGTGYTAYQSHSYYGDQPIIAFVNPMHVVSVPESETRKLRCCEYYPFKITTPQEVIDIEDSHYFIFENDYKKLELEQLMSMIDKNNLKVHETGVSGKRVKDLQKMLDSLEVGKDSINKSLSLEQIKEIVSKRLNVLNEKYPSAIQL